VKEIISTNITIYDPNSYTSTLQISMFKNTRPDELAYNKFKKEEDIPTEHEKLPAADLFSAH